MDACSQYEADRLLDEQTRNREYINDLFSGIKQENAGMYPDQY
jgi:hypothetical protein